MNSDDIQRPPKFDKKAYEAKLKKLQTELIEMQQWMVEADARIVIMIEGRDVAGKGSTTKRITQYLNPRVCRTEALSTPTSREQGQWYFQRYVEKLPTAGGVVISDRSWYNHAGIERIMGFCTSREYRHLLHQAPISGRLLVEGGIILRKYWFSVSDEEQIARFKSRREDPLYRWEFSSMDSESIVRWEDYSRAKGEMPIHTDILSVPWYAAEPEDKKRSRINVISHLLTAIPYEYIRRGMPEISERPESEGAYEHPPRTGFCYIPDIATKFEANHLRDEGKSEKKGKKHRKGKESKEK